MIKLVDFLVSREAVMAYIVAGAAFIIYLVVSKIRKLGHERLMKRNTEELNNLVVDVNEALEKEEKEKNATNTPKEEVFEIKVPFDSIHVEDIAPKNIPEKEDTIEVLDVDFDDTPSKVEEVKEEKVSINKEAKEKLNKRLDEIINKDEEITYAKSVAPAKEEAKKELQDTITKLEEEKEESKIENIELTDFEKMQEDTAIISLDELEKKAKEVYDKNDIYEASYQDEGNEPITIEEFEARRNGNKEEEKIEIKEEEINANIKPVSERKEISKERKFKSSPVISPVYGILKKEPNVNELELENTANYEKLDEEIRKTNEFMGALKELQRML